MKVVSSRLVGQISTRSCLVVKDAARDFPRRTLSVVAEDGVKVSNEVAVEVVRKLHKLIFQQLLGSMMAFLINSKRIVSSKF